MHRPEDIENQMTEEEEMLKMSPLDFDQSPNGWRKVSDTGGDCGRAVELIRKYIDRNLKIIITPREGKHRLPIKIMYFHIGQLLASQGPDYYQEAIKEFKSSVYENSEDRECWNAYVSATIGFLEGDINKVEEAIETINNSKESDKMSGNLGIVINFKKVLLAGENSYNKAYNMERN